MVCHSLLQWTTFCQTSPPWPVRLGWPHTAWLSFIELGKTVVCVIRLASFLWLWFQCVCPLMPSRNTYRLTWVSLTLDVGFVFTAAPAKCKSLVTIQWKWEIDFKGLDLIDRKPDELWTEVRDIVQETGIKTILMEKKCKKAKCLSEEALQIAVKRGKAKSKGEKEIYPHLNAEFQRIARRDKKSLPQRSMQRNRGKQ